MYGKYVWMRPTPPAIFTREKDSTTPRCGSPAAWAEAERVKSSTRNA